MISDFPDLTETNQLQVSLQFLGAMKNKGLDLKLCSSRPRQLKKGKIFGKYYDFN